VRAWWKPLAAEGWLAADPRTPRAPRSPRERATGVLVGSLFEMDDADETDLVNSAGDSSRSSRLTVCSQLHDQRPRRAAAELAVIAKITVPTTASAIVATGEREDWEAPTTGASSFALRSASFASTSSFCFLWRASRSSFRTFFFASP
jgi:hypothetical protein